MKRIRRHLTYANVMATLAVFIALGGTALASVIITSNSQVAQNTISGHKPPSGDHPNIIGGSINGLDVTDNSLTGADIKDRSGVDTCQTPLVAKFGPICAGSDGGARDWFAALHYCSGFGLRLPSLAEAVTLAEKFDVPGVSESQSFWTDEAEGSDAELETENGSLGFDSQGTPHQTVCVTDPSA